MGERRGVVAAILHRLAEREIEMQAVLGVEIGVAPAPPCIARDVGAVEARRS